MFSFAGIDVKGDIGSEKVLEASKKMGKKYSPCALMTVAFDDATIKEGDALLQVTPDYLIKALEENCNFEIKNKVDVYSMLKEPYEKAAEKERKSQKKKIVGGLLSGKTSVQDIGKAVVKNSALDAAESVLLGNFNLICDYFWSLTPVSEYYTNSLIKALKKGLKTKGYVYAYIQVGTIDKDGYKKKWAKTSLYFQDNSGEVVKKIHAGALSDVESLDVVDFEDVVNRSIDLATANFAKKDRLFSKDGIISPDSTESVSDVAVHLGFDTDVRFDIQD